MRRLLLLGLVCSGLSVLMSPSAALADSPGAQIAAAAEARTSHVVRYDGSYRAIPYPLGDVPDDTGVCSDVVIRSLRSVGIDLQKEIHEDMVAHFGKYPNRWGLSRPDPNIDHRRVPNIQTWLRRQGAALPISEDVRAYLPGDIVTWNVAGRPERELPHIGIVSSRKNAQGQPLIVHNIGSGTRLDDMLFQYRQTGHYRLTKLP